MTTAALISCGKKKLPHRAPAADLYTGPLFKLSLAYARRLGSRSIYILSAKHGLLPLTKKVAPYDKTLAKMPRIARKAWGHKVIRQNRK
jgi:hypothetical protein